MSLLLVVGLVVQGIAPLRKSDLVRLLSGSVMTQQEIAQLVRRNCLSFDPTERDRRDFRRLGAEAAVVAQDSVTGTVALKPEQAGTTSLAVIANGLRQYLTVTVPPRAAPGKTDCP